LPSLVNTGSHGFSRKLGVRAKQSMSSLPAIIASLILFIFRATQDVAAIIETLMYFHHFDSLFSLFLPKNLWILSFPKNQGGEF